MAAAITHIVLAKKVFPLYFFNLDQGEFLVGTSFPDIRYLGVIERDKTHIQNSSLKEIAGKSAFEAGLYFHSLVDEVREKFMVSKNIYSLCPSSKYITQSLKLFEDELLYNKIHDWQEISSFFNTILNEEVVFGLKKEDVMCWHGALKKYVTQAPTAVSRAIFVADIKLPASMGKEINAVIDNLKNNDKIHQIIYQFYDSFDSLL